MKVNEAGLKNAKALIEAGKVDITSRWEFTTADENKILDEGDWSEYSKWFLGIDEDANEETKARYKFPFGKDGKVYRSAVIAIRQRAGQFGYKEIFDAAGELLTMIDKPEFEEEKWFTIFWNGRHRNKGAKKEWSEQDVERIYERNKDREIPLVVKHPENDLPIVGFAKGLRKKIENGKVVLEARLNKISRWLFEVLKKANMDKVSIALEPDLATIRHIGFVEEPAVEGLPAVTFENEFVIDKEEMMNEELKRKIDELEARNRELEARVLEFEREKREAAIREKIDKLSDGLPQILREKVEKIVRSFYAGEFEADKTLETFEAFVKELPKIYFESNVVKNEPVNDFETIEKKVSQYKGRRK